MTAAALVPIDPLEGAVGRIVAFLSGFSLEATKVTPADIAALQKAAPANMPVYLTAVPGQPVAGVIEPSKRLRAAGFEPVPHLAVRNIASAAVLDDLLSNLAIMANVRRALVIAGDRDRPAGPYASALDLIESGLLQRYGVNEIGIAGYPEGHPRISALVLQKALTAKVEAAEQAGLKVHIVTQFCFDARSVIDWIAQLRDLGIENPVRIGMAGPTNLATLIRYAQRCGVRASVVGLNRNAGLLKHLVGTSAPDGLIRPLALAAADGRLGQVAAHFYSFGGVAATARWASAAQTGHIVLDRADGFRVEPP
jgi:methylenetetrahydrofolate reductase (NADPH)